MIPEELGDSSPPLKIISQVIVFWYKTDALEMLHSSGGVRVRASLNKFKAILDNLNDTEPQIKKKKKEGCGVGSVAQWLMCLPARRASRSNSTKVRRACSTMSPCHQQWKMWRSQLMTQPHSTDLTTNSFAQCPRTSRHTGRHKTGDVVSPPTPCTHPDREAACALAYCILICLPLVWARCLRHIGWLPPPQTLP